MSPGDISWIEDNFLDFCRAFDTAARGRKSILESLSNLPEIRVGGDQNTDEATFNTLKDNQVDPLNMSRVSNFARSPILHVRTIGAEWQIYRYREMSEIKKVLELRALNLQRVNEKNPDAKLEKQIAYIQSRIDNYAARMRKVEESVND